MIRFLSLLAFTALLLVPRELLAQQPPSEGEGLYQRLCSNCHDNGVGRAPNRAQFRDMPAERVLAAIETGNMVTMANNRTAAERRAIAEFLTGKSLSTPLVTTPAAEGDVPVESGLQRWHWRAVEWVGAERRQYALPIGCRARRS